MSNDNLTPKLAPLTPLKSKLAPNELYDVESVIRHQVFKINQLQTVPFEDLMSAGYEGYLRAQRAFKPEYGRMTLKYAESYIRKWIWKEIKREWNISSFTSQLDESPESNNFLDNLPAPDTTNPTDNIDLLKIVDSLDILTEEEAYIIKATYLAENPKKLKDLSKELDRSLQRVHQIKQSAIEKLRDLLDTYE